MREFPNEADKFIVEAHYPRGNKQISVKGLSYPEPWEDFKILRPGYEKYYHIKPGDVVIDGGAYIGMVACYAAKIVGPKGHVYAFEPIPSNFEAMKHNVFLNDVEDNTTLKQAALWNVNTELTLEDKGPESTLMRFTNTDKKLVTAPAVKLDDYLYSINPRIKVAFIKLDVEGSEIQILMGAKEILESSNVKLAIASYHNHLGVPTYPDVEKFLKNLGFNVITECPQHLTTYAWK